MDESFTVRDLEAHQIAEENAMLEHLVRTFHPEPLVNAAPRRWLAHPMFDRIGADGASRR
jgi:hypothetical protein